MDILHFKDDKPLILVANDDGIRSPGLHAAIEGALELGQLLVAAPFARRLRPPVGSGMLHVVQHELITVIAKYTDSTWVPESMIKMHVPAGI